MTCNVVKIMRNLKKPIIAAVNGIAAGAGAMLMLASDLRIFSDKARVALAKLIPISTSHRRFPVQFSPVRAVR